MSFLRDMVTRVFGEPVENLQPNVIVDPDNSTYIMHVNSDGSINTGIAIGTTTGTKSNVVSSGSSVTILASNSSRKGATIYNDSTQVLYLDLSGGTASSTSYSVQVPANALFELPVIYTGAITGIWSSANGSARVTEFS